VLKNSLFRWAKILRSIQEGARDLARDLALTEAYLTSRRQGRQVERAEALISRGFVRWRLGTGNRID
jgi:hypothetical protein